MATYNRVHTSKVDDYTAITTSVVLDAGEVRLYSDVPNANHIVQAVGDGTSTIEELVTVAEYSFADSTLNTIAARKLDADVLYCTARWPGLPLDGSTLTLTLPATSIELRDGDGTGVTLTTSTFTITNVNIKGYDVIFRVNETSKFTTLNNGPLSVLIRGAGGKLVIS